MVVFQWNAMRRARDTRQQQSDKYLSSFQLKIRRILVWYWSDFDIAHNSQETATFFKELQLLVGMTSLVNVRELLNLDAGRVWWKISYGVHQEILSLTFYWSTVNRATFVLKTVSFKLSVQATTQVASPKCYELQLNIYFLKIWNKNLTNSSKRCDRVTGIGGDGFVDECQRFIKLCRVWRKLRYGVHREILSLTFYCFVINCSALHWHVNRASFVLNIFSFSLSVQKWSTQVASPDQNATSYN